MMRSFEEGRTEDRGRDGQVERPGGALLWACWGGISVFLVSWLGDDSMLVEMLIWIGALPSVFSSW